MKTIPIHCNKCNVLIPEKELEKISIPTTDGIPQFFISKIVIECPNEHPNECEVRGI